jgi:hypothetical protein
VKQLHQLAAAGELKELRRFIDQTKMNIDEPDEEGSTALVKASKTRQRDVCLFLLENKANVDSRDVQGNSPSHYFSMHGDLEMLSVLVANGADLNAKNSKDESVLHWGRHHPLCTAFLVDKGATIPLDTTDQANLLSDFGRTENWLTISILVKRQGLNINEMNSKGSTVIDEAAERLIPGLRAEF